MPPETASRLPSCTSTKAGADSTKNPIMPVIRTGLRPKRSDSRPTWLMISISSTIVATRIIRPWLSL